MPAPQERKTQAVDRESGNPWVSHVQESLWSINNFTLTRKTDVIERSVEMDQFILKCRGTLQVIHTPVTCWSHFWPLPQLASSKSWQCCSVLLKCSDTAFEFSSFLSVNAPWNIHQVKIFGTPYGTSMYWSWNGIDGNRWKESKSRCWFEGSRLSLKCWLWWSLRPSKVLQ